MTAHTTKIYDRKLVGQNGVPTEATVDVKAGDRVELMPWTDLWMQGARFGTVTNVTKKGYIRVQLDRVRKSKLFNPHQLMTI